MAPEPLIMSHHDASSDNMGYAPASAASTHPTSYYHHPPPQHPIHHDQRSPPSYQRQHPISLPGIHEQFHSHLHQPNSVQPPPQTPSYHPQPPQPPPPQQPAHSLHHPLPTLHQPLSQPRTPLQHQQLPPPPIHHHLPSAAQQGPRKDDGPHMAAPPEHSLMPMSRADESNGRRYTLDVAQQPVRARMCGFGDKDRRPITPPPCVRLIITDDISGKEVDISSIDHSLFVLTVDLWDETGAKEVNLVRSSQDPNTGSYSQVIPTTPGRETSYPPNQPPSMSYGQPSYSATSPFAQTPPSYPPNGTYGPPTQYFPRHQGSMSSFGSEAMMPGYGQETNSMVKMSIVGGQPHGMFTRNLIGSLAAGAFRLSDTQDHLGIWFVLQDLSVRTEGTFRLKFSFVDVSQRDYNQQRGEDEPKVNTGHAAILATAFTDVFTVYSAKKFPGVCESTPLSKTFATQGIKIPIRKEVKGGDGNDDDD